MHGETKPRLRDDAAAPKSSPAEEADGDLDIGKSMEDWSCQPPKLHASAEKCRQSNAALASKNGRGPDTGLSRPMSLRAW
jgi:hypothetical protein